MCIKHYKCENKKYRVVPATSGNGHKAEGTWCGIICCAYTRVSRARLCACVCTRVCRGKKYIGTIHQPSTCNQRFEGLMTVRFNDHTSPSIPDGTLSYQKRGERDIDKDTIL